ncbi:tRNA nucleotidyltransferase [Vibrio phage nt-1]|uniref:tRNA nucleotidyltransferase n=1 Tax=Vibrio phage nt-1 TaxID=115992 RepID=A0A068J950_9CAUD|nr:tRNA nucleotidyltransferase [Vibrio phage nt-1]AIE13787.1 tRNA nucleotidyltransferase [Vibrio phage nt-1]
MGFTVAEETVELCKDMINDGMLNNLPKERVWLETLKALSEKDAHIYFLFLSRVGFFPLPSVKEIQGLKFFNRMKFRSEDDQLYAKWVAFNRKGRFSHAFGATKKYTRACDIFFELDYANAFDETIILTLEKIGAYKGNFEFQVALSQISDAVKRRVITEIIDLTKNIKVDVEPGPAYGEALTDERVNIAYKYLRGEL